MSNSTLALLGGDKTITHEFGRYNTIGEEEKNAAIEVIESGVLSQYLGAWHKDFYGGPKVLEFEAKAADFFQVNHAITVNSWTSGLIAAVGAIGIEPGDEIIVSPWTMCASATAIMHWNAIPVFADIDPKTFCLDPISVEKNISPQTKAIITVDIFGQSSDIDALQVIANKHNLKIITDAAQAPGAHYKGCFAGTLTDIGGYSLNYHKHIHTGEGGILVTNDDYLAEKLKLIRNHAEAVVVSNGQSDLTNMIGYNFRLGEIECAIGIEQLKKLPKLIESRQSAAEYLTKSLQALPGLTTPYIQNQCDHVYYVYPLILDSGELGVSRSLLVKALLAEGVKCVSSGYQNIHRLPMYEQKQAYGSKGFPWTSDICQREVSYGIGTCPIAEELHDKSFIGIALCMYDFDESELELIVKAFKKVWQNVSRLRQANQSSSVMA